MNYKVMQRPMFKLGGKAASQGTGITSGLDEKVNMTNGRANYAEGPTTYQDFLGRAMKNYNLRQKKMADMNQLINLQALGKVSNVLGETESNNPFDILQNIAMSGTEIALPALSAKKSLELKNLDPSIDLAFAKALKPERSGSQKVYEMKKADLARINADLFDVEKKIAEETDKAKIKDLDKKKFILQEEKNLVFGTFKTDEELRTDIILSAQSNGYSVSDNEIDRIIQRIRGKKGNAEGGVPNRVNRFMGSGDEGELPPDPTETVNPFQPKPIKPLGKMDAAMETQGQDNSVYAMLRTRLPQEVPDEVVKLISYNKQAFADFASIENQEDVASFNEKYNVELVIDVATV